MTFKFASRLSGGIFPHVGFSLNTAVSHRPAAFMLGTALGCFACAFDTRADDAHPVVLEDVVVRTTGSTDAQPLQQTPTVGKTGTKLEDLPQSITIIPQQVVKEQGGTDLKAAIRDVSGVSQGGGDGFGFGDRLLIRGLNP